MLGYWRTPIPLRPVSDQEVVTVLHQPIGDLLDPSRRFSVAHPSGWRGPAFEVGTPMPLWGFTAGIIARARDGVKLLGVGELTAKLSFEVTRASKSAIEAVEKAGGSVSVAFATGVSHRGGAKSEATA